MLGARAGVFWGSSRLDSRSVGNIGFALRILLSNDDGYQARGLLALIAAVEGLAELVVMAPETNQSGASHSLTLDAALRVARTQDGRYYVTGTPTDCVHLAVTGFFDQEPDMVIAGINHGANLGDDVLYSGTVAAAAEGRFLGLPAIAVSLVGENPTYFDTAADVIRRMLMRLIDAPLPKELTLNVNVPDLPVDQLRGIQATRLGYRHRAEPMIEFEDPKGRPMYWVGPAGPGQDAGPGTDFFAIENGYVSVTPLQFDLTKHKGIDELSSWLPQ